MEDLSTRLDEVIEEYNQWVVEEKKDSPLIPYERIAIKTYLMRQYMIS